MLYWWSPDGAEERKATYIHLLYRIHHKLLKLTKELTSNIVIKM